MLTLLGTCYAQSVWTSSLTIKSRENKQSRNKKRLILTLKKEQLGKSEKSQQKAVDKMPAATGGNASDDKPMDDEHRKILKRCREELAKDMEPVKVLRQMVDPHLFSTDDEHEVKAEKTREKQCDKFLDMLARKGAKAYDIFMETITKAHPHLANVILNAENLELRRELSTERIKSASLRTRLDSPGSQTCLRCSGLEKELDKLRTDKEKYEKDIRHLQEANDKGKKEYEKMDEKRKTTNREANETIRQLNAEKRELEKEKENLKSTENVITQKYDNVKAENDQLAEKARNDSSEIERLNTMVNNLLSLKETLEEQINKSRTFVSTVLRPGKKDFQSVGVISTLKKDASAKVVATRSSDGTGKACDVLSRRGATTNCGTAEIEGSWWCVDLGENYLLFPTHCSLRHGKKEGDSILRGWKLQGGSIDGKDWKDCQRKNNVNDQPNFTAPIPYVTGTWPVEGKGGAFRYLRILQTSRNSSGKYGFYLSRIEFYGVLVTY